MATWEQQVGPTDLALAAEENRTLSGGWRPWTVNFPWQMGSGSPLLLDKVEG